MEPITIDVAGCARCDGEGHKDLAFLPLRRPSEIQGLSITHWASCPTTGEPIFYAVTEVDTTPEEDIDFVFDGPPSAEAPRFVETEDGDRRGVGVGAWVDRGDGSWALRVRVARGEVRRG